MNLSKKLGKVRWIYTLKEISEIFPNFILFYFLVCVWRKRQNHIVEKRKHCTDCFCFKCFHFLTQSSQKFPKAGEQWRKPKRPEYIYSTTISLPYFDSQNSTNKQHTPWTISKTFQMLLQGRPYGGVETS